MSNALRRFNEAVTGAGPDPTSVKEKILTAVGEQLLKDVKKAFVVKAEGGTGEDGVKWKPLHRATIARRKITPTHRKQDVVVDAFERVRQRVYRKFFRKFRPQMGLEGAREAASNIARGEAARQLGQKAVAILGGRDVLILMDTRAMYEGLTFDIVDGRVVLRGEEEYTEVHDQGGEGRWRVPRRQIFPENDKMPKLWVERMAKAASDAYARCLVEFLSWYEVKVARVRA